MSVAGRVRTTVTGKASSSDSEAPPSFFGREGRTTDQSEAKPVSAFLSTDAVKPRRVGRRSLRARFRSRFFARIFRPR